MVEEPEASVDDSESQSSDEQSVDDASTEPAAEGQQDIEPLEGDQLPADLDITGLVGPYEFPNNSKRRIASVLYFVIGAICVWLGATVESSLVNEGLVAAGIGLILFAIYSFVVAVDTKVEETDALAIAGARVGFPVGHAAAQMNWRGWRSRPVWRILVYSDESPQPEQRALVLVDGVSGEVREHFVEENPEDWSDL